ncbi:MAG: sodium/proton-translocating pyrophosphatase, partial [Eubacterium sp.]
MLKMFTLLCCIAAIAVSGLLLFWLKKKNPIESTRVQYLNGYIICGISRYLRTGVLYTLAAAVVFFLVLLLLAGQITAGMYAVGAVIGLADGLLVSSAVIVGNTRVAAAAVHGDMQKAQKTGFYTAVICGAGSVGISVLGLLLTYWSMNFTLFTEGLPGLLLGVSMVAFLGRAGGEVFAKMYDVVDSLIAGAAAVMILAQSAVTDAGVNATFSAGKAAVMAFVLIAAGILTALIAVFLVRKKVDAYGHYLDMALIVSSVVVAVVSIFLSWRELDNLTYSGAVISGIAAGLVGELTTRIYTDSTDHKMREMVREGGRRAAMLERLSQGMSASILPVVCLAFGIGMAYYFAGNYGIGLGAVGIVSVSSVILVLHGLVLLSQTSSSVIYAVATDEEADRAKDPM